MSNGYDADEGPSWDIGDRDNHFNQSRNLFHDQNLASSSSAFDPFRSEYDSGSSSSAIPNFSSQDQRSHSNLNPLATKDDPFKAELMTIKVDDPQKSIDRSFVTFRVFTMTALESFLSDKRPVRRRFRDFVWLHNALSIEFPACVIPPLPEKHRINYMKGTRFDSMFIEQRRLGLQWFMDRIARHPLLQASQFTRLFLESTDFKSDKKIQIKSAPSNTSVFGSFFKSAHKVKKPDEKFVEMKENIDKFEDNLNIVEKLYSRIGKRQQELEQNYDQFAGSIRGLSALEVKVDQPLRQFAEATESYVEALKEMRVQEDLLFLNDVHELLNYCNAAKEKLQERDEKQVSFEDTSTTLQSIVLERERLLYPGKNLGRMAGTGMNISEFMTDKMSVDGRGRNERVIRLETRIKELQEEVVKANDDNNAWSEQMTKEYKVFQKAREAELKQGLASYADCHIEFYKKSISIWQSILPVLDEMQLEPTQATED